MRVDRLLRSNFGVLCSNQRVLNGNRVVVGRSANSLSLHSLSIDIVVFLLATGSAACLRGGRLDLSRGNGRGSWSVLASGYSDGGNFGSDIPGSDDPVVATAHTLMVVLMVWVVSISSS